MRKAILVLAGTAGLVLAAGSAAAQSYSWGNAETTYFNSPSTTYNYNAAGPAPMYAPQSRVLSMPLPAPEFGPQFSQPQNDGGLFRRGPDGDDTDTD